MCPISTKIGRPIEGFERKAKERKFRIEPLLDDRLKEVCKLMGISQSEAIRQGVILFLKEADKILKRRYENDDYYDE